MSRRKKCEKVALSTLVYLAQQATDPNVRLQAASTLLYAGKDLDG
jgi:hypothetical protein